MATLTVQTQSQGVQHLTLDEGETLCPKCKGRGRWDSCFNCGNRGYMLLEDDE